MQHHDRSNTGVRDSSRLKDLSLTPNGEHLFRIGGILKDAGSRIEALRRGVNLQESECMHSAKADGSIVTNADLLSSELISLSIREIYGDVILLNEEDEKSFERFTKRAAHESAWILDPLDNTRGYVQGRDDYSLLLTHIIGSEVQDAFIAQPACDSLIQAHAGYGSYRNHLPIRVSQQSSFDSARCLGVYTFESFTQRVIDGPSESTEALVAVACGDVDIAVIKMCGHKIWDVAFASLLVSEAGGCVSDDKGSPLSLHELAPSFEWIIATNGRLHPAALKWFAETIGMR